MTTVTLTFTDPLIVDVFTKYKNFDHNLIMRPYALFFQQFADHFQTKQTNDEIMQQFMSCVKQTLKQQTDTLDTFKAKQTELLQTNFDRFALQQSKAAEKLQDNFHRDITAIDGKIAPMSADLTSIASKFNSSSNLVKGTTSEAVIYNILAEAYPAAHIQHIGATVKHECDILFERGGTHTPKVLIENKDYTSTVTTEQVKKFIADIKRHQCCGLLLSQGTGITHQDDFSFRLVDGFVCVFLHAVKYDLNKINVGLNIIDHLYEQLQLIEQKKQSLNTADTTNKVVIEETTLHQINGELKTFATTKTTLLKLIQDQAKTFNDLNATLKTQLEGIRIPTLHQFLSVHCNTADTTAVISSAAFHCKICSKTFTSQTGLSQHMAKTHNKKAATATTTATEKND